MMQRLLKSVFSNKINIFPSQLTSLSWLSAVCHWCWCAGWGCPAWCCCTPCTPCSRTPSHPPAQDQPIERSCTCWYRQISCCSSGTRPAPSSHWPPCWLRRSQPSGHLHIYPEPCCTCATRYLNRLAWKLAFQNVHWKHHTFWQLRETCWIGKSSGSIWSRLLCSALSPLKFPDLCPLSTFSLVKCIVWNIANLGLTLQTIKQLLTWNHFTLRK